MKKIFRTMYRAPVDEGAPGAAPAPAPAAETPAAPAEPAPAAGEPKPGSLVAEAGKTPAEGEEGKAPAEGEETPAAVEPLTAESITFPEGVVADEAALADFLGLMNDTEISPAERAQKLIDLQLSIAEEAGKASQALWDKTQADWQAEALALPEIGGDKLPKTLANIKSGLDKLGATEATYAALNITGAGNHPEIIRILNKATAHLIEGQPTAVGGTPAKGNLSQAARMYTNSNME